MGGPCPGAINNQQLLLDEQGFGDHGTRASRTGQSGDRRQQMQKQDSQIAHRTILTRSGIQKALTNLQFAMHTRPIVQSAI